MKKYNVEFDFKMTAEITVEDNEGLSEDMIIEKAIEQFFSQGSFRAVSKPVRRNDILATRIVDSYEEDSNGECEACIIE